MFLAVFFPVWTASSAQETKPSLELQGSISYANRQTYLELPFAVPAGTTRVSVSLTYTQRELHTNIDLGVFDPERFRGWSGGNKSFFTISATDATPSYLPGPLPEGHWTLILGVPNIEPDITSKYVARIWFERAGEHPDASTFSQVPLRNGAAWYRGDFHMHDGHSDGSCGSQSGEMVPCPLYKTVEAAAKSRLDFIAITDHNTISQYNDLRELQPLFDRLLLLPGREITTFQGHANVFGTTEFIDFRLTSSHVPTTNDLLRQVQQKKGFIFINHPGSPSGATCMGCGWTAPDTDYRMVGGVEVLNGGSLDGPRSGIPFWEDKLNRGFRLTGIGGSDNHEAEYPSEVRSAVGHPTTVVYAQNLSEKAILEGLQAGHVYVDLKNGPDPGMEFTGEVDGKTVMMGDTITVPQGKQIHLTVKANGLQGLRPELVIDGQTTTLGKPPANQADTIRTYDFASDGKRHWIRVNIRSERGVLLILGNPIYLNFGS
jgi:hypothetical protein